MTSNLAANLKKEVLRYVGVGVILARARRNAPGALEGSRFVGHGGSRLLSFYAVGCSLGTGICVPGPEWPNA